MHTPVPQQGQVLLWGGGFVAGATNGEQVSPSCTGSQKHPKMSAWLLPEAGMCCRWRGLVEAASGYLRDQVVATQG